mgnify:CR=1 FL=1
MQDRQLTNIRYLIHHKPVFVLSILLTVLAAASLACSLPGIISDQVNGEDGNVETSVVQTMAAQDAGGGSADTDTPAPPPDTPTLDVTDTPTLTPTITETPTPEAANVHVTGDTFCRSGPGSVYDRMGIMNPDEESEIIAKNPTGEFWYVVNPDDPSQKCWIWGNYATPEGPTAGLPVYTPPPSPTPGINFSIAVSGFSGCVAPWFQIDVVNNGGIALESYSVTAKDTSSGNTYGPNTGNAFDYDTGCLDGPVKDTLSPGDSHKIMSAQIAGPSLDYDPSGKPFRITVKICSKENLNGVCLTRYLSHTP